MIISVMEENVCIIQPAVVLAKNAVMIIAEEVVEDVPQGITVTIMCVFLKVHALLNVILVIPVLQTKIVVILHLKESVEVNGPKECV